MTLEELARKGFVFSASHYSYTVAYEASERSMITISHVSYRLPHSKTELLEKARRDALRYYMACRLDGAL